MSQSLWDLMGIDALAVMTDLFGEAVGQLAPFQSLETGLAGQDCSVLRLCDRNFRIADAPPLRRYLPQTAQVQLHQFGWLGRIGFPAEQLSALSAMATVRPPHRLAHLPLHCAVPIQVEGMALLLWHHCHSGQPTLDCHIASPALEQLLQSLPSNISAQAVQL
ncbi:MAG: hypothetical protein AAFZ80_08545 [Cyanobacteria bacterium P01_A01_bin.105]